MAHQAINEIELGLWYMQILTQVQVQLLSRDLPNMTLLCWEQLLLAMAVSLNYGDTIAENMNTSEKTRLNLHLLPYNVTNPCKRRWWQFKIGGGGPFFFCWILCVSRVHC
jgi:hypothetical protein